MSGHNMHREVVSISSSKIQQGHTNNKELDQFLGYVELLQVHAVLGLCSSCCCCCCCCRHRCFQTAPDAYDTFHGIYMLVSARVFTLRLGLAWLVLVRCSCTAHYYCVLLLRTTTAYYYCVLLLRTQPRFMVLENVVAMLSWPDADTAMVSTDGLLYIKIYKNECFAKTGSGQT